MDLDLKRLESLLPKYDLAGPRYTSYPTAPVWSESHGAEQFETALRSIDRDAAQSLALYVHVPFCRELCHYCACNRVITKKAELPTRYLSVIAKEIEAVRACLPAEVGASQIHLGGGTPTHLSPAQIDTLMESLTRAFPVNEEAELSEYGHRFVVAPLAHLAI